MADTKPLRLTKLEIENVKKIKVARLQLDPDGNVVLIRGENGAGKSSALDAIHYLVGGKDAQPPQVIRTGETSARVTGEFAPDGVVIERTWSEEKTTVEVRTADGAKYKSPQALLDSWMGPLRFNPGSFLAMDAKAQADALKKLTGLDFSKLDAEREKLYAKRTQTNADGVAKAARLKAMAPPSGLDRVEVKDLLAQQEKLRQEEKDGEEVRRSLAIARKQIPLKEAAIAETERALALLRKDLQETIEAEKELSAEAAALTDVGPAIAAVREKIAGAENVNARVAADIERAGLSVEVDMLRDASKALTQQIAKIDEEKARQLAEAKMPVPGLGFGADGITLNGVPFVQASQAEKLRVAFAMWLSAHPKLAVAPIQDASLFDKKSLALVAQMAQEAGVQVLLEVVGDGDVGIVFEDGEVVKVDGAAPKAAPPPAEKKRRRKPAEAETAAVDDDEEQVH
jgi:hypothetical protein